MRYPLEANVDVLSVEQPLDSVTKYVLMKIMPPSLLASLILGLNYWNNMTYLQLYKQQGSARKDTWL